MSPEKQREAIAIICGYEQRQDGYWRQVGMVGSCGIPNYPASLDAMHEAEKVAGAKDPDFWVLYLDAGIGSLPEVCQRDDHPVECATAAQRAEAFLKTHNRWEDWQ